MPSHITAAAQAAPSTPALVVDADTLDRNIARMAAAGRAGGFALRPHAKTHKCPQIAEKQLAAGAVGLTVATIGEAEAFAAGGVTDLFIAYPLWLDDGKQRRLAKLAAGARVQVGVDSVENARRIAGTGASVLIEIDSGHHRTGVRPGEAGALARAASELGLTVDGVFTFPGHGTAHAANATPTDVRAQAARDQEAALTEAAASLRDAGIEPTVVSGGSTPTAALRGDGQINELRPGVYVFNDAMQVALGSCTVEDVALAAAATVVSVPAADRFVLDAGSKVLGADPNAWSPGYGLVPAYPGSKVVQLSEHHAVVQLPPGVTAPRHGDRVVIIPNHVCNAVNLAAELVIVREGRHVESWPVAARGANS
ncbi:MAG TPA: alanine racemase [Actinospica sp.]|nr:alanine racemase [Actinospica sp.]HWG24339.1 alanine racemase [Actinospica sp.]